MSGFVSFLKGFLKKITGIFYVTVTKRYENL